MGLLDFLLEWKKGGRMISLSLWPHFAFGGLNLLQTEEERGGGTDKSIAHLSGANV